MFKGVKGPCEIVPPTAARTPKTPAEDTRVAGNGEDISLLWEEKAALQV